METANAIAPTGRYGVDMRSTWFFGPVRLSLPILALAACSAVPTAPGVPDEESVANSTHTDANLKVAFIGDQGINSNAKAVLHLIEDEGADMVLHQGDFDYQQNPQAWETQVNGILGPNFPYFGSVGNHDLEGNSWSEANGYQDRLEDRLTRISGEVSCTGDYGVRSACSYRGLFFILSGTGTLGGKWDNQDAMYITDELAASNATWSICAWHKNQREMQVGGKGNEAGWPAYQACLAGGAIVATGHEHSYSRTHLMDSFQGLTTFPRQDPNPNTLVIEKGRSFAFVSGLGGRSIRTQQRSGNWWASIYTSTQGARPGALFCTFNVGNDPNAASCYFKATNGYVADEFNLVSAVNVIA